MASELAKRLYQLEVDLSKAQAQILCLKNEIASQPKVRGTYSDIERQEVKDDLTDIISELAYKLGRTENSIAWEIDRQIKEIKQ